MLLLPGLAKVDSTNTVYSHLFITLGQFRKHYLYQHCHNIVHSYFMGFFPNTVCDFNLIKKTFTATVGTLFPYTLC